MDDWMTAAEAVAAMQSGGNVREAQLVLMRSARDGLIRAKALRLIVGNQIRDDAAIDRSFWWAAGGQSLSSDWNSGFFETWINGNHDPDKVWLPRGIATIQIRASRVSFDRADVAKFAPPELDGDERQGKKVIPERPGGRRPAAWWPAFAEELACYIHEFGVPEGRGGEGQGQVIDAVFARMSEAGKVEGSRTSVQPVVQAVLNRIRSAGN